MSKSVYERFFEKVLIDPETHCWLWIASLTTTGYGKIYFKSSLRTAHKWAYEQFVGPVPNGLELDHLCRIRHCVNPWHLEAVSHQVNVLRGQSPQAYLAALTVCQMGHQFDADNTYRNNRGERQCRICQNQRARKYRAQRAA